MKNLNLITMKKLILLILIIPFINIGEINAQITNFDGTIKLKKTSTSADTDKILAKSRKGTITTTTYTVADLAGGGEGGDVSKVGTPVDNQVGVWTGDGTLEGNATLTFNGTTLILDSHNIWSPSLFIGASGLGTTIQAPFSNATITLPSSTGTLALTTDGVQGSFTGGSNSIAYSNGSGELASDGLFQWGGLGMNISKFSSTLNIDISGEHIVFGSGSGAITLVGEPTITGLNTITLPNATGTVALLSDIPSNIGYTVATLPAGTVGDTAYVTDADASLTDSVGASPVGGGAFVVPVFFDGTAWIVH